MKYGENIRGGTIKSRVIIVINNNQPSVPRAFPLRAACLG